MPGDAAQSVATVGTTAGKPYALVVLLQLHWFIRLRWLFAAGALAVLAIERFVQPTARRPGGLLAVVLAVAATNVVWMAVSRLLRPRLYNPGADPRGAIRAGQIYAGAQIATDLFLLTWILALTGGVENPMALFYLFHVAITGLLLRTWQAFLLSCWAVLLYAAMGVAQWHNWLAYYPFLPSLGTANLHNQAHYVSIAVTVMAAAVFGTLYFTDRIGHVLDRREDMLIRMNAALEQSRRAIQDLQARRSRFMQVAAHQLKGPLAMVQTLASLVRDGTVTDEQGIHATCDKIVRRCREGIVQVTELLTLARVQEADPCRHRAARADVTAIVTALCARFSPVAQTKRVTLEFTPATAERPVAGVDPTDLADCIGNLIENAVKYTPEGGRVEVRVVSGAQTGSAIDLPQPPVRHGLRRRVEDFVCVVVQDTGIGLGEALPLLEDGSPAPGSIFEAFRRGAAALSAGIPGTGLGLSIVREVVEQVGGYIHVRSRTGEGSTFTVCFPVHADPPESAVHDSRSGAVLGPAPPNGTSRQQYGRTESDGGSVTE